MNWLVASANFALLTSTLLAGACARTPRTGSASSDTPQPPTAIRPEIVYLEAEEWESWPRLFLGADGVDPADIAREAGGLVATIGELSEEVSAPAAALTEQQRLLVLAHLRDRLQSDPDYLADPARARLRNAAAALVLEAETGRAVPPTDEEVRARYDRDIANYTQESRVSVRMILVPTEAEAGAVLHRLAEGESFAAVAAEASTHTSRDVGGEIEPFVRGTYSEDLEAVAFALSPGERDVVTTARGIFILEKIAENRGGVTPFADVQDSIRTSLRDERREAARRAFLETLERRYANGGS